MKMKKSMMMIMAGVGGTLLYQNVKNGNLKKMVSKMDRVKQKAIDDLEDMI